MHKQNYIIFICILLFWGCTYKKVQITTDYIINPNWNERANAIEIIKLRLKPDSLIHIHPDLTQGELLRKLEDDSSFFFGGNVKDNGEKYLTRKVYFNKKNGFSWWSDYGETKTEIIGNLQKMAWYKFSNLVTYPLYIYVYIDSSNQAHSFEVNRANY